jgi:hypothetical protein
MAVTLNELKRLRTRYISMANPTTGLLAKEVFCEQPEVALNPFVYRLVDMMLDPKRRQAAGSALVYADRPQPRNYRRHRRHYHYHHHHHHHRRHHHRRRRVVVVIIIIATTIIILITYCREVWA